MTQAGPGKTVKQGQEEISRNHVQTFISPSVELADESENSLSFTFVHMRHVSTFVQVSEHTRNDIS